MTRDRINRYRRTSLVLSLVLLTGVPSAVRADEQTDANRDSLWPRDFLFDRAQSAPTGQLFGSNKIRVFGIIPGFLTDPVGLDLDDPSSPPTPDDGPNWVQLAVGTDNPFFDLRRRGDVGGVGYYRLYSQLQLLESQKACCTLGFQAVTPAGRESNGVEGGPTYISPALSYFQSLDDNLAFQAFVGKRLRFDYRGQGPLDRDVEYGVALHRPVFEGAPGQGQLFVFVEALGRYRFDDVPGTTQTLDMVPGLQFRLSDNWWLTGGLIVPMMTRPDFGQWQFTCQMHF
jgi:hypothetical protein